MNHCVEYTTGRSPKSRMFLSGQSFRACTERAAAEANCWPTRLMIIAPYWLLVAAGFNEPLRQTFWVGEEQLVATGHPHETQRQAGPSSLMPTPFAWWKAQCPRSQGDSCG